MEEKFIKQSINRLDITMKSIEILKSNNITTLGELCKNSKNNLRKMDILPDDDKKIVVELQLLGLNLKNNL